MKRLYISILFSCLAFCYRASGQGGIITTVAGNGLTSGGCANLGCFSGDGGLATSAQLWGPGAVAVDASGNLFIADTANNRIRKVTFNGIITTVAGSSRGCPFAGTPCGGFSGDGGPATSALLSQPTGLAVDASGNLFIADSLNIRIRKVSAGGIITTVAGNGSCCGFSGDGGPATSAELNNPTGIAVDNLGNLFIADSGNGRIRKVSASGIITTVAGNGTVEYNQYGAVIGGFSGDGGPATAANLTDPTDVAVDASGNLFIADSYNGRLRRVSASSGIITTIAGTGISGNTATGIGGPASSAYLGYVEHVAVDASDNLFIVGEFNQVWYVSPTSGIITTVAGNGTEACGSNNCFSGDGGPATAATLDGPAGVAVDASGNLYIADAGNSRIREVSGLASAAAPLTFSPANLSFSIIAGGSSSHLVSLVSVAGISWTASTSASWITLTPTSGTTPGAISVGVNTASLQPGAYTASVTISNPPASPSRETVSVSLTVNPSLSVAPATLSFLIPQGGPSQSQSMQIGGASGAAWQATGATSTGGAWLSVSSGAGQIPTSLTATANPVGLTAGTYQGNIAVQASGEAPPSGVVGVTLTVAAASGYAPFSQQGGKLVGTGAANGQYGAQQGYSVALSSDGNTAIVGGALDNNAVDEGAKGAAWMYTRSGGVWTQQGSKLVGANAVGSAYQGESVALSADGNTAIVGGPLDNNGVGAAWAYTRSGGVWTQQGGKLVGASAVAGGSGGNSVALSSDGNTALVGGYNFSNSGSAWVFTRSGGAWTQQSSIGPDSCSVALSADGNTAVLGITGTPRAWVYTRSEGVWTLQGAELIGANIGNWTITGAYQCTSVALSADGNTAILGGAGDSSSYNGSTCGVNGVGAVWVFTRSGSAWTQQGGKLVGTGANAPCGAGQGYSVALSDDGNAALVGGPFDSPAGATWVYTRSGGVWAQQGSKLVGSGAVGGSGQGYSVALSSDTTTALVGGTGDNSYAGAAWVFASPSAGAGTCSYSVSPLAPSTVAAAGGNLQIAIQAGTTCAWSVSGLPSWITVSESATETGASSITLMVAPNPGLARTAIVTIAGASVQVNQSDAPVVSGLNPSSATAGGAAFTLTVNGSGFVSGSNVEWNGSPVATTYISASQVTAIITTTLIASPAGAGVTVLNPGASASNAVTFPVFSSGANVQTISHIADGGGWRSSIILVNTDTVPALYAVSFWSDTGAFYAPPLASGSTTGSVPVGGSTIIETADTASVLSEGWAEVTSSQSVGGTAIFRYDPSSQEAAVPLLTSGGVKLKIPYQVGSGLSLGIALANPSATQSANITEVIRDQNGNQLASRALTLPALNHTAFNPTFPSGISGGGVVEYDANVNIFGLGIRSAGQAFTSLDAVLPLAASTKTISHIADGGGWRSSIILVNTDTVPVSYTVSFWNDSGASYTPPLALGATTGSIPVGGSTTIETADTASALSEGWAEVISNQSVGGTAIFRYDPSRQEAAVPLLTSGGAQLEIPYQVGNGLSLGVALANPSATQTANITEVIRDQNGNQLASRTLTLGALNHTAFNPTFPSGISGGGVVEYDSNVNIFALGIRSATEGGGLAFTSVRAAYK